MTKLCESAVEEMAIEELQSLGYTYISGIDLAPDALNPERNSYGDILLMRRLQAAMSKLNPIIPADVIQGAARKLSRIATSNMLADNEEFHKMLVDGVPVEYRKGSDIKGDYVHVVDFENPLNNEFLVVNQYTIVQNNNNKRPDVLLFVNGIPLVIFELKNPADENATCHKAFDQLQAYKLAIPGLFTFNEICVISDGLEAKAGSLTASYSRFSAWKTKDGIKEAPKHADELSTLIHGLCTPATLIDYLQSFVTYEKTQSEDKVTHIIKVETAKKIAAYHQYYAVNKAVASTIEAAKRGGTKKAGVIWHTQGAGKSLSMVFFTGKIVQSLNNPTILVINDRNDLDDQLFDTFADNSSLLRQPPKQAEKRDGPDGLKSLLKVASGGIIFSTIQKFFPDDGGSIHELLSVRDNIIVIADEAHRTQYGFNAKLRDIKENGKVIGQHIAYGFAKYIRDALPNATFIGFTGTPVEKQDANTPAVFGNYIDIYDIAQAVEDKVTVRIFYESRLAKVNLTEEGRQLVEQFDTELDDVGEADEATAAKMKWAKLEAIVGNEDRIRTLANDIVTHFEERQNVFEGKALIVAMSRRIAVILYDAIIKLRPEWHSDDLNKGVIKVVMTSSSSDGAAIQKHHTTKAQRKALALRLKDEDDPLKIVIVRDMWLTGFDVPCLNAIYIDKPMKDHNLMQAIARVNRVFKDKPGGLIVDYIGIATNLKKALGFYAESGGKGVPAETHQKAVEIMLEKIEVVRGILHGFDYSKFFSTVVKDKLSLILQAEDFILGVDDGKNRYIREVSLLGQAYALAKPDPATFTNAEEIAFFQAVKARLTKFETGGTDRDESYDSVIRNIVNSAIATDQVVDIFSAAGLEKPDLSILSEEFLKEIEGMKYKNVAIELLKKLLSDEIKLRSKHNFAKSKSLMELLDGAIKRYQNNLLTTAEIIEELIRIAREINATDKRGQDMGLSEDELAFYDALETNDSAVKVLGDEQLREIAREIADKVRKNATIDFAIKETARARIMVIVRRILNRYGYPPDKQPAAIDLVMKQAENLADVWTTQ